MATADSNKTHAVERKKHGRQDLNTLARAAIRQHNAAGLQRLGHIQRASAAQQQQQQQRRWRRRRRQQQQQRVAGTVSKGEGEGEGKPL